MLAAQIINDELIYVGQPEVGEKYPGYCCAGFDFEIAIAWPKTAAWDSVSGYGCCLNPNCPNWDGTPDDMYRGVKSWQIEDFAERIVAKEEA